MVPIKKPSKQLRYLPILLLIIFLTITNPRNLPVPFLLIPLALLLISTYLLSADLLSLINGGNQALNKPIAAVISFIVIALVVLQTISQLTFRDSLLFTFLAIGLAIYLYKLRS